MAAQVLLVVAAPALRGEIARLYGVLSNDPARPMVDRFLVEQIVAADRSTLRDQIARELSSDAPLVRHGVVQVEPGPVSLFTRLSVSDALLDRLRGMPPVRVDDTAVVRGADVALDALRIPPELKRALVLALAEAPPDHAPLRLVVRGRRGERPAQRGRGAGRRGSTARSWRSTPRGSPAAAASSSPRCAPRCSAPACTA